MATDFFDHQARAHRNTRWLLVYFVLAVLGIIVVLQLLAAWAFGENPLDPRLFGMIGGGVVVVVALGSLYKIAELSHGGGVVAEMLGGRLVDPHSTDPNDARLHNIVEEMAIASGLPVPDVYVLDHEAGINAFAAGNRPADAVVAVTRGTMETLTRDELQGVVAHEFSHILNGDMRMNIRLMGVLNGILLLAILGQIVFRTGFWTGGRVRASRDSGGGGGQLPIFLIGVGLFVVGSIGLVFARLIKAAVSRQREFLADASAVQFTRNPEGIAGALWKIGRATSRLEAPRAEEASHLFFGNGVASLSGLFATHPPIEERIRAIAPNFDPAAVRNVPGSVETAPTDGGTADAALAGGITTGQLAGVAGANWTGSAGRLDSRDLVVGAAVLAALPDFARAAARETGGAVSMIYALLLSVDDGTRRRQMATLDVTAGERAMVETEWKKRDAIAPEDWLCVVDLCLPALRKLSREQFQRFRANVRKLVETDGQVDLFEYVLQKALLRHLDGYFDRLPERAARIHGVMPVLPEVATVLWALAWFDSEEAEQREAAYAAGVAALGVAEGAYPAEQPAGVRLGEVDAALDRLGETDGATKRVILEACGRVVMADGRIEARQGALLRAVADTLGCPIPPFARRG